ncbi:MAG: TetR family transcriptional regulator [Rhodospirillales bacterium]|nr:TetR family transcriptional regulator [Rhodospirillales bacterium]
MVRKTKEETENTRARILDAALDCFYERGFSRTSFDDIAKRINMTKGAVYWHFKEKGELLAALMQYHIKDRFEPVKAEGGVPKCLEDLRKLFAREIDYIVRNSDLQKFLFFVMAQVEWSDEVFNKVMEKLGDIRIFGLDIVQKALTSAQKNGQLRPDVKVDDAALAIMNLWRGSLHYYVSNLNSPMVNLGESFLYGLDMMINQLRKEC